MKWNVNTIVQFLNIYEQYPALWNMKEKDYRNAKLKDELFQRLLSELNEKQLIEGMDVKQLKSKIKSIKDVYRQELHKIENSKKRVCGNEEVYSPKLAWFSEASYLAKVVATRSSKSNLDPSQNSQEAVTEEASESCTESVESDKDNSCPKERYTNKSPANMRPPATSVKRVTKRAAYEQCPPLEISEAILQLNKIAQNASEEKPYDQFGKLVACELRQLPQRQAVLLQHEIQNCIIRSKLSSLDNEVYSNPQEVEAVYSNPQQLDDVLGEFSPSS